MIRSILILIATITEIALCQISKKNVDYASRDYPDSLYQTTKTLINFGLVSVNVIEVKTLIQNNSHNFYCRTWMKIKKESKIIENLYFPDLEPVGGQYGLFIPKNQPSPKFFFIIINNDYDGRLLIINKEGKITETVGGYYFISNDKKYLFSEYYSDIGGLAVIDLKNGNIVYKNYNLPNIDKWYFKNRQYYFITDERDSVYIFDNNKNQLIVKKSQPKYFDKAKLIQFDFPIGNESDCNCRN